MAELPLPTPTVPKKPLLSFKILTFDIYGTLINWETSIVSSMDTLLSHLDSSHPLKSASHSTLAGKFNEIEGRLQREQPRLKYDQLLSQGYELFARETLGLEDKRLGKEELRRLAVDFGNSIESWQPFPDTVDAMKRLKKYFRLAPLSNVDNKSFGQTLAGPLKGVDFDAIYTAEDIGSYKPDHRNFEYLFQHVKQDFDIEKDQDLHVAQSLFHDHVPAKELRISSVWICRLGAGMGGDEEALHRGNKVGYGWRFGTLGEFADAVEKEAEEAGRV